MNTATTTLSLHEGFFSRRNWFDWLFAAIVAVGGAYAFARYAAYMDVYEKGILHRPRCRPPSGSAGSGGRCAC